MDERLKFVARLLDGFNMLVLKVFQGKYPE